MMWADELIVEYEQGRRDLNRISNEMKINDPDDKDRPLINSMIRDMTFSLDWLKTGREPGALRGIDRRSVYQSQVYMDMDLFPSLELEPETELSDEKKKFIIDVLLDLSARERQCYVLHNAYCMSVRDIASDLKIADSSVQKYLERANKKVRKNNLVV